MPILAGYKLKVAARLNPARCEPTRSNQFVCGYLSIVLIVGLGTTRILGWWWLDSVAALALIPFLIKEARAAISGEWIAGRSRNSVVNLSVALYVAMAGLRSFAPNVLHAIIVGCLYA